MKELWNKFWSTEAYAIRILRLLLVGVGTALVAGQLDAFAPESTNVLKAVGALMNVIGAALTGGSNGGPKSGLPGG